MPNARLRKNGRERRLRQQPKTEAQILKVLMERPLPHILVLVRCSSHLSVTNQLNIPLHHPATWASSQWPSTAQTICTPITNRIHLTASPTRASTTNVRYAFAACF